MEIELEFQGKKKALLWGLVILVALIGLIMLGRSVTPSPPRLLSWSDWRFMALQREYSAELGRMRRDAAELANLLDGEPTLRTAWQAERLANRWRKARVVEPLSARKEALAQAAQAVEDWAVGRLAKSNAQEAVSRAIAELGK